MTQQSQSEIPEIIGGRQVCYDLHIGIRDGVALPRGWMGLAITADRVDLHWRPTEIDPKPGNGPPPGLRRWLGTGMAAHTVPVSLG